MLKKKYPASEINDWKYTDPKDGKEKVYEVPEDELDRYHIGFVFYETIPGQKQNKEVRTVSIWSDKEYKSFKEFKHVTATDEQVILHAPQDKDKYIQSLTKKKKNESN